MTVEIAQITFDCTDPYAMSQFWAEVTGWEGDADEPNIPEDEFTWLQDPVAKGTALYFQRVPEGKVVKNRLHLDLAPKTGTRDEEYARLLSIGATLVDDQRKPDGTGWVVLADIEGNEFCVERGHAERGED